MWLGCRKVALPPATKQDALILKAAQEGAGGRQARRMRRATWGTAGR
jgi:hypothetical protein